jgi:hypothetical protein
MPRSLVIAALVLGACGSSNNAPAPIARAAPPSDAAPAFDWPIPDGWRGETIPFPLEFAPTLAYRGVEELRFPPGFLDPGSTHFFSYAFAWVIDPPLPDASALERDLSTYFGGGWKRDDPPPFAFDNWHESPRLEGSAAALSCLVEAIYEGGDHWIVVGRVAAFQRREDGVAPLVFHSGRYVGLAEPQRT